jgi:hypothetical protein
MADAPQRSAVGEGARRAVRALRRIPRWIRLPVGVALVAAGLLGFLPVLGFWMIPLGLLVLSLDLPALRRWHSRLRRLWRERRARRR